MDQNNMLVTCEEKMTVWDRRVALLEYLQESKRATVDELMNELNVSRRRVLRDVTALTQTQVRGRYGGVYLSKNKNAKKLTERQKQTLKELLTVVNPEQQQDIHDIISKFGDQSQISILRVNFFKNIAKTVTIFL